MAKKIGEKENVNINHFLIFVTFSLILFDNNYHFNYLKGTLLYSSGVRGLPLVWG
ncbi:hypothetical protein D3C80_1316520 [compost metagenome]